MSDGSVSKDGGEDTTARRGLTGWRSHLVAHPVALMAALLVTTVVVTGLVVVIGRGDGVSREDGVEAGNRTLVADIVTEPDTDWSYSFASPGDTFVMGLPVVVPVTDDTALVWPRTVPFKYDDLWGSECESECEAFSTDYNEGYGSGHRYARDYGDWMAFDSESGIPSPTMEDYYPDGTIDSPSRDWVDGFNAARWGWGLDLPDFSFEVSLIDLTTGVPMWELDVVELAGSSDYISELRAIPVTGTEYIVFQVRDENAFSQQMTLVSVDSTTGEVVSDTKFGGDSTIEAIDGGLFVLGSSSSSDVLWVGRLNPSDLSAEPVWKNDVAGARDLISIGDYLVATDYQNSSVVFDARTGDKVPWGNDIDDFVFYDIVDDQLIRYESGEFSFQFAIVGKSTEGVDTWTEPVGQDWVFAAGQSNWSNPVQPRWEYATGHGWNLGANVILVAEQTWGGIGWLERLNPKTGKPMWDYPYRDDVSDVIDVFSGVILALMPDDSGIVAIDLATGEKRFSQPMSVGITGEWPGVSMVYVSNNLGELTAYSLADGDQAWTYRFDATVESIFAIGDQLFVVNHDQHTISRLR